MQKFLRGDTSYLGLPKNAHVNVVDESEDILQ